MANKKLRLDMALVERGFFQSRNRAQASIMAGEILVNGQADTRADRTILPEDVISIKEKSCPYVSRGGLKLAGAIKAWNLDVKRQSLRGYRCGNGGIFGLYVASRRAGSVRRGRGQGANRQRNAAL